MEKDKLYDSVIEMTSDIRHMREDIFDLKREQKENAESFKNQISRISYSYENRISRIEKIQNLNTGKLAVVLLIIGAGILGIFQFVLMLWDKIPK